MQAASAALVQEQTQPDQKYYRIVELYKRYWNGSAFVWDSAQDISAYVVKVGVAKWKLDTRGLNEWKSPSFQIEVDNPYNIWSPIETNSIWNTGAHQPYQVELSRIRVRTGHVMPDGTKQDLYVFGGVINMPIAFREEARQATLYVVGLDEILKRVPAQSLTAPYAGVSTLYTLEAVGADSGTVFSTAHNGVGGIFEVRVGLTSGGSGAASIMKAGVDYSTTQMNDAANPGKVTLTVGLSAGKTCWVTYCVWYQNKDLSWIVTQLLTLAGISSYQVDPTIFSNAVGNAWLLDTQADFEAGVHQNTESDSDPGGVRKKWYKLDDFSDLDFTNSPSWQTSFLVGGASFSAATGKLVLHTPDTGSPHAQHTGMIETPFAQSSSGTYEFKFKPDETNAGDLESAYSYVIFAKTGGGPAANGYALRFQHIANTIDLVRVTGSSSGPSAFGAVSLAACGILDPSNQHTWRVTITAAGLITVYKDTVQVAQATDTNYTSFSYFSFCGVAATKAGSPGTGSFDDNIDDVWFSYTVDGAGALLSSTPIYTSPVKDMTAGVAALGKFLGDYPLNGGSALIETFTSATSDFSSGNDPAGWLAVSATGQILSATLRYIKWRITFTDSSTFAVGPEMLDATVNFYTSTITIPLVNLSGLDCWAAIQECAKFPTYEIGFTASEKFFYRSRTTTTEPVLTVDAKTNLEREISFNWGTDQVITQVVATFGGYAYTDDASVEGEARPNVLDIYGLQQYSISSNLLPATGVDVATAVAKTNYAYLKRPRKRSQVQLKYLEQYELGDPTLYKREHKFGRWHWGDPDRAYGVVDARDFIYYSLAQSAGWDIPMRIEGIEFDSSPNNWRVRYDLTEILP